MPLRRVPVANCSFAVPFRRKTVHTRPLDDEPVGPNGITRHERRGAPGTWSLRES
jgi:hypothetical protein